MTHTLPVETGGIGLPPIRARVNIGGRVREVEVHFGKTQAGPAIRLPGTYDATRAARLLCAIRDGLTEGGTP